MTQPNGISKYSYNSSSFGDGGGDIEEFISRYGEALHQIGFSLRDILRLSSQGLQSS